MGPRHETKNGVVYIAVHESGPVLQTRHRVKPNRQRREPKARFRPQRTSVLVSRRATKPVHARPILPYGRLECRVFKKGHYATTTGAKQSIGAAAESMSSASVGTVFMPKRAPGTHYRASQDAQNALTLSNKRGKANVFVTTTMNPSDVEVQRHLKEVQVPSDRFDVINRVFSLKVNLLVYCTPRIPFELTTTSATRYRITDISRCRNSTTT